MKLFRQERAGITELSKKYVDEHLPEIGEVKYVLIYVEDNGDYITEIRGSEGMIVVDGFSWGYGGEGPHGLLWLLRDKLGGEGDDISIQEIASIFLKQGEGRGWVRKWKPDYRVGQRN